jgi:hypothetical protein
MDEHESRSRTEVMRMGVKTGEQIVTAWSDQLRRMFVNPRSEEAYGQLTRAIDAAIREACEEQRRASAQAVAALRPLAMRNVIGALIQATQAALTAAVEPEQKGRVDQ